MAGSCRFPQKPNKSGHRIHSLEYCCHEITGISLELAVSYRACSTWGSIQQLNSPRSIMHGRIVSECKRSDTAFSHRIRSFSTVYDTVKYGPYETGQIWAVYGHKRPYTRRISAYTVTVIIVLGNFQFVHVPKSKIPKEPAGKRWKKPKILHEYTGSHRNMEAVFQPENFRPVPGGMHRKKSRNFPTGILLPCSGAFLPDSSRTL